MVYSNVDVFMLSLSYRFLFLNAGKRRFGDEFADTHACSYVLNKNIQTLLEFALVVAVVIMMMMMI